MYEHRLTQDVKKETKMVDDNNEERDTEETVDSDSDSSKEEKPTEVEEQEEQQDESLEDMEKRLSAEPPEEEKGQQKSEEKEQQKKVKFVEQAQLNRTARSLRLTRKEVKELKKQNADLIDALNRLANPNAGKEQPQPLNTETYRAERDKERAQEAHDKKVDQAIEHMKTEMKTLADQGLNLPNTFEEELETIMEDNNLDKRDPVGAVTQALEIWKKENLQEVTEEQPIKSEQKPVATKTPETIRKEQKTKATGPSHSRKSKAQEKTISEDMSLEEMEKVLGIGDETQPTLFD